VQAMQYWLKLAAISVPAFVLLAVWARTGGPAPAADLAWQLPLLGDPDEHTLYRTYSLLLALALGTMGLPHVLVRFYTNPDGGGARRTTVTVIALLGIFYVFTPVYGVLGKTYLPVLPDGARVDSITLRLPSEMLPGLGGDVLTAVLAGGAFAAFLSTASGLSISVTGVINQDLLRPLLARLSGGDHSEVRAFRYAAVPAVVVPYAVSPVIGDISLATMVGLAFAVAASTFAPLLVLGVWWPRLTTVGAACGLVVGGVLAAGSVGITLALGELDGWPGALLAQPGAWTVPTAAAVAVAVSLATPHAIPRGTGRTLARLHTPEGARSSP
jgi:cation/acetate symporter